MRVKESLSVPSASGDSSSVDSETREEEPPCEQLSGDLVRPEATSDSSASAPGESPKCQVIVMRIALWHM